MNNENIRSVTLRVAVFFGLTTFTLCIAIFYIESILDDNQDQLYKKDSIIRVMEKDMASQQLMINENEHQIEVLKEQVNTYSNEVVEEE